VGLINIGLGIIFSFPPLLKPVLTHVPIAALTIPVAGVGLTYLAINQITPNFASPLAGFLPLYMMFVAYFSRTKVMFFAKTALATGVVVYYFIPEILSIVIPGYALGWAYQLAPAAQSTWTFSYSGGGLWAGNAFIDGLSVIGPYMGSVIPLAIVATSSDLMCLVGAFNAGDPYPIGETLISDGIGTLMGAVLGSPFGTVVYFGHPIHKRLGGKVRARAVDVGVRCACPRPSHHPPRPSHFNSPPSATPLRSTSSRLPTASSGSSWASPESCSSCSRSHRRWPSGPSSASSA
jgi:AGZA family xanthine/uracil permease-like MFS transporter